MIDALNDDVLLFDRMTGNVRKCGVSQLKESLCFLRVFRMKKECALPMAKESCSFHGGEQAGFFGGRRFLRSRRPSDKSEHLKHD